MAAQLAEISARIEQLQQSLEPGGSTGLRDG
jgi:hypothetical protein